MADFELIFSENENFNIGFLESENFNIEPGEPITPVITIKDVRVNDVSVVASNGVAYIPAIPTKTSELVNDSGFITSIVLNDYAKESWVLNKFAQKSELDKYAEKSWVSSEFSTKTQTGCALDFTYNNNDCVINVQLKNNAGSILSSKTIQLPLNSLIQSGRYDESSKNIVLITKNGQEHSINIAKVVDDEENARKLADILLQQQIEDEALSREDADTQLQTNINAEKIARENSDSVLQSNINTEKTNRENVDSVLENKKVDKVIGKGLSTNDFTNEFKTKLEGIEAGAEVNVQSNWKETDTTNDAFILNKPTKLSDFIDDTTFNSRIATIEGKIPTDASTINQLADKDFVNSSIESVSAYYITKNKQGDPFSTKAELDNTTTYYSGGVVRVPTRNDYCLVLSDETKEAACTRYIYHNAWQFQYIVNNTPFTAEQLKAINSGITNDLVSSYNSHLANTSIHVTTQDKTRWDAKSVVNVSPIGTATSEVRYITIDGVEKKFAGDVASVNDKTGVVKLSYNDLNEDLESSDYLIMYCGDSIINI